MHEVYISSRSHLADGTVVNNIHRHYIIDMKPRRWDTTLCELAENQSGYFTAAQARAAGLHPVRLVQLERNSDIERLSRGVYRLARYPISPIGQYMEASLWPQVRRPETRGTISHESALVRQAIEDGRRTGYLSSDQTKRLKRELLDGKENVHKP